MKRLLISLMLLCTFIPTQTLFAQSFSCNEFVCECSSSESSITPTDSDQFAFTANVIAAGDTLDIAGSLCNDLCFDLTRTTPGAASYEVQCLDNGIETLAAGSVTDPDTYIPLGEEVSEIPKPEAQVPNLAVPIPGLTFSQNFIGEYVNAIYQLLLVFASVISIIMIMVAGLQWMMARGDAGKVGQAKERIGKAILSIVVILLVAAITTLIDPRLTNFNALTIKSIDAIPLSSTLGEEGAPGGGDAASCAEAEANAKKSGTCSIEGGIDSPTKTPYSCNYHFKEELYNFKEIRDLDYPATFGSNIYASFDGTVTFQQGTDNENDRCGNRIRLIASDAQITICHVKDFLNEVNQPINNGSKVNRGDVIGHVGGACCAGQTPPSNWSQSDKCTISGTSCSDPYSNESCSCQPWQQSGNTLGPHVHMSFIKGGDLLTCHN